MYKPDFEIGERVESNWDEEPLAAFRPQSWVPYIVTGVRLDRAFEGGYAYLLTPPPERHSDSFDHSRTIVVSRAWIREIV